MQPAPGQLPLFGGNSQRIISSAGFVAAMKAAMRGIVEASGRSREQVVDEMNRIDCPNNSAKGKGPYWFVRGDVFLCVSCNKSCSLTRPEGVILPLPLVSPPDPKATGKEFSMTPGELVTRKKLLRIDEAAYCLNISERLVYNWVAEGKLRQALGTPVRVSADDVAFYMQNFEP